MAMTTKFFYAKAETRRSSLRSNSKCLLEPSNCIVSENENKSFQKIHIEIKHQENNNATKSTLTVHQEPKICQDQFISHESPYDSIRNMKLLEKKSLPSESHIFSLRSVLISHNSIEKTIQQNHKASQELQKFQLKMLTPPTKSYMRHMKKTESSLYQQERKSYRKVKKSNLSLVPHRKFQDPFEHRIVVLINKICHNKHNNKQIESLTEKIQKISYKDIFNPYVVSGIQTILNLFQKTSQVNVTCLEKLKSEVRNLSERILMQLDKIDSYENVYHHERQVDISNIKPKLIKKVYRLLIREKKCSIHQAKQKSFVICEAFFNKFKTKVTEDKMIYFLRQIQFMSF